MSARDDRRLRLLISAEAELRRAERAAAAAARHEALIDSSPALAQHHASMARIQRGSEARHRTSAALCRTYAGRIAGPGPDAGEAEAEFMSAVGSLAGEPSVALTFSDEARDLGVLASDGIARAAHELEFALGEGPAHDVASGGSLQVTSVDLAGRWPHYGRALADLGVRSVAAVPLGGVTFQRLGSLVAFGVRAWPEDALPRLGQVADAVLRFLLSGTVTGPAGAILRDIDHHPAVHQAAGILAERLACPVDEALLRLRARAFADDVELARLARSVVEGAAGGRGFAD